MRSGSRFFPRQTGAAYLLLLLVVALMGVAATGAARLGAAAGRQHAEAELLATGLEFQRALRAYAAMGGGAPGELDDLLRDPRSPGLRRHLRELRADPLTGKAEWGLVRDAQQRIVGIHSLAQGVPYKRSGFAAELAGFDEAGAYKDWVFGLAVMPRPAAAGRAP